VVAVWALILVQLVDRRPNSSEFSGGSEFKAIAI
jgi:hypothetical protein